MTSYYNDNDRYVTRWLRNLVIVKELPAGDVSDQDIRDVKSSELLHYDQCHFFAGIGGWPLALKLAGWEGPVWTGSCPCQPFSTAGSQKGFDDERHLWPEFYRLISECRPPTVFGEQIASKLGREWLAGIRLDMEALGYAFGAADLPAASMAAPHIRQRIWWVGHSYEHGQPQEEREVHAASWVSEPKRGRAGGSWSDYDIVSCSDEKARRIESGIHPLAYGVFAHMGRLRAYGNAIVPQVAAEFIKAFMDYDAAHA